MKLGGKKLFLGGFIVVLLVGIPVTVFLLQKQQEVRSHAAKSTNITFTPTSSQTTPIVKNIGDTIPLDINVDPGNNLVSFVKLEIQYDPEKLATASAFQINTVAFPGFNETAYSPGKILISLAVGPDPTKAIQQAVKAGTMTFKALANTNGTPTLVTYGATTQVLSLGSNDQASENVLSAAAPAAIQIGGAVVPSGPTSAIPTGSPTPTVAVSTSPTEIPSPTLAPSTVPTPSTSVSPSPSPTSGGGGTGSNVAPVCNTLTLDRAGSGDAPFSVTFTANGTDSDGTVSKVSFNFGDGQVSDVTTGGGVGTNSVNTQVSHTYNNVGTYQASALLTDNGNSLSDSASCKQTITVTATGSGQTGGTGGTGGGTTASGSPTPTMAATGSTNVAIGIGAAALLFIIGGGLLFFIL